MSIIKNPFTRIAAALTATTVLSGCLGNMDSSVATIAGTAIGAAAGGAVNEDWGPYVGGAVGGGLANAWINTAQQCQTTTTLGRDAQVDNTTNRRNYDVTNQSEYGTCNTYGGGVQAQGVQPIFRDKHNPSILEPDELPKAQPKAQPAPKAPVPMS